ncbi:MAG: CRISPR-associated endonuclease Cas3'' [Clostridiaceae bacterium]
MKKVYAHSKDGLPPDGWQPLDDHLKNVAEMAAGFAALFDSGEWAYAAGLLHDVGKADDVFQGYLHRSNGLDDAEYDKGRVNHSSAGAALAVRAFGNCAGKIIAYIAAGHHAGLPDWFDGAAALSYRMSEGATNLARIDEYAKEVHEKIKEQPKPPTYLRKKPENYHLWNRLLFSCLVDADYLDTEQFMDPHRSETRGHYRTIKELQTTFDAYMASMTAKSEKTHVNKIRQGILADCRKAAANEKGLYTLTVPTGGGKTFSSMAFALDHAVIHGKTRIIYVIPYTSIIEQTAKALADILGPENVIEHHSNIDPEHETERSRLASENWDAPVIVTTNVQFFESLYAAKSSRCRKLHNLVNSVVIFDEAQLLPEKWLAPCVEVINQLVHNYGVTALLSTATQPALPGLAQAAEIITNVKGLYKKLRRTSVELPIEFESRKGWEEIAGKLREHEQVLCIVNTKKDCRDLFGLMPEGTLHLSTWMCGEHRSRVITEIKEKLKANAPVRVVSTQLVEAGVDIDFPVVYRAFAGLSSIAQAAGRCNREGKQKSGKVNVFVPDGSKLPDMIRKGADTMREFCHHKAIRTDDPAIYPRYFDSYYGRLINTGREWIHNLLIKDVNPDLHIQFRTAGFECKLIDDQNQQSVFVDYGDSRKCIELLRQIGPTRDNLRRLQRFTVNLYRPAFLKAQRNGLVSEIGAGYWSWIGRYDYVIGLDLEGNWMPEDLTI